MGPQILKAGWHNWNDTTNETTARYGEYGSKGPGGDIAGRVEWAKQLTPEEVTECRKFLEVFKISDDWSPQEN